MTAPQDRLAAHITNAAASSPAAFVGVLLAMTKPLPPTPAPNPRGLWSTFTTAFMRGFNEHKGA